MKYIPLILFLLLGCIEPSKKNNSAEFKICFGIPVPVEYIQKKPISKLNANSIKLGNSMKNIISKLGAPSQDSGTNIHIWHYMVEDGTYLQVHGKNKCTKVFGYSNDEIR
jgi:hypothetical protein